MKRIGWLALSLAVVACLCVSIVFLYEPKKSAELPDAEIFAPGSEAIDFALPDLKGNTIALIDFRGKIVLLNFWATWCAPCIAEMPALEHIYRTYREKGLEVIAVNVDPEDSHKEVAEFVKEKGLTFTIVLDPEVEVAPKYGLTAFPESFFISPQGTMLEFLDPETKERGTRLISDIPWDSPPFVKAVGELLDQHLE